MKKTAALQASYRGGMIEGVSQDSPSAQGQGTLQSVAWLENYNHTLQEDSAIKRWGEVDSGIPYLDRGIFCPNVAYEHLVGGFGLDELDYSSWLQGVQIYSVVHPTYHDNYVAFLKRTPDIANSYSYDFVPQWIVDEGTLTTAEALAVVGYAVSRDGVPARWQETWADNNYGSQPYLGWYTFGSLSDVTKYGQVLLFTTTLQDSTNAYYDAYTGTKNPVNDYLYPLYRYLYWDIRKKRNDSNQFINVNSAGSDPYSDIATDTTGKYRKWKVLPPSRYVIDALTIGVTKGAVQNTDTLDLTGAVAANDINICIEECIARAHDTSVNGFGVEVVADSYIAPWANDTYHDELYSMMGGTYLLSRLPNDEVISIETLDLDSMNDIMIPKDPDNSSSGPRAYKADPVASGPKVELRHRKNEPFSIGNVNRKGEVLVSRGYLNSSGTLVDTDKSYIATVALDRYTVSKNPRMWMYGETIDLILTATLSGNEVLLSTFKYTVTTQPGVPDAYDGSGTEVWGKWTLPNQLPWVSPANTPALGTVEFPGETITDSDYNSQANNFGTFYPQGRSNVASKRYLWGMYLYFTIELKREAMDLLVDSSATALSLWACKADPNEFILRSTTASGNLPDGLLYNRGLATQSENVDYTKFALLKKFVIDGRTEPPTEYSNWPPGQTLATNAWVNHRGGDYYVAVPINEVSGTTLVPNATIPPYATEVNVGTYMDAGHLPALNTDYWTPDFVIWDYPYETSLFLNSSGKYWKGLGAKLITVIKGRTFIGGCIGADGIEEQAILRYSDVQGGAISPDIFSEERKIQIGHIPHTALLEFREQLWAFSRYQFYRIQFPSITQEETWEFLDVVEQGCFNNKCAVVVPYGVVFCNEGGVWLSGGTDPQNIALPVLPTYQNISTGTSYIYTNINELAGVPYINDVGVNPYMELTYDSFNDEILVYSPLFLTTGDEEAAVDFTMIFSFKYKTWRIETAELPAYQPTVT